MIMEPFPLRNNGTLPRAQRTKEADFQVLEETSSQLLNVFRREESKRDYDDQFRNRDFEHHKYFLHPHNNRSEPWEPMLIPLPPIVQEDLDKQLHTASFMGIFPEINRIWITIDSKVIFWNYLTANETDRYDGLNDVVVSVTLSAPKPGVFLDSVKYLIVVSTTVDVTIMAVSWNDSSEAVKIIPTVYTVSTDDITMLKVVGSQSGRIFMGGHDGNLYELDYDNTENKWASLLGFDGTLHKCQKVSHHNWAWTSMVPPFIRSLVVPEESITNLVVDNIRHLLYVTTSGNRLRVVYLGNSNQATQYLVQSYDVTYAIKAFLNSSGRSYDSVPRVEFFHEPDSTRIIDLFVVPVTESRYVHAIAVLQSGARVYFQFQIWSESRRGYAPYTVSQDKESIAKEAKIEVVFIRGPPNSDVLRECHSQNMNPANPSALAIDGALPATSAAGGSNKLRVVASYYSHGVFLAALAGSDSLLPDELIGIGEDLLTRKGSLNSSSVNPEIYEASLPSLRESVCTVNMIKGRPIHQYKIFDIKESSNLMHNLDVSSLLTLTFQSASPSVSEIKDKSNFQTLLDKPGDSTKLVSSGTYSPLHYALPLGAIGRPITASFVPFHATSTALLSEFCLQALPLPTQRQFLCLTRFGLIVLVKLRPLDYLVKLLLQHDGNLESQAYSDALTTFFKYFGHVEACSMCVELLCGVPEDLLVVRAAVPEFVGSQSGLSPGHPFNASEVKILRERALRVLLRFGGLAFYESLGRSGSQMSLIDPSRRDHRVTLSSTIVNYYYSCKHDAIVTVAGRVLRTIWFRPVVESKTLSPIWTPALLSTLNILFTRLLRHITDLYSDAVSLEVIQKREKSISASSNSSLNNSSGQPRDDDADGNEEDKRNKTLRQNMELLNSGLMTDRMASAAAIKPIPPDPAIKFAQEAKDREDVSIHGFWRVLFRSQQLLVLLQVLTNLESEYKIPVPWSDLGEISFRTAVVVLASHDRIKRLIHAVLNNILRRSTDRKFEFVADDVSKKINDDCFLFFSSGDRYAYEAMKVLDNIRGEINVSNNSSRFLSSTLNPPTSKKGINLEGKAESLLFLLLKSCQYWVSLEDVKRIDASNDPSNEPPLLIYCQLLNQLGLVGKLGIVRLSLSTANNFMDKSIATKSMKDDYFKSFGNGRLGSVKEGLEEGGSSATLRSFSGLDGDWDRTLYHVGRGLTEAQKKQAREACYACLCHYLRQLCVKKIAPETGNEGQSGDLVAINIPLAIRNMVDLSRELCEDPLFRAMLYETLLQTMPEELLRMQAADIEAFLRSVDSRYEYNHLYRYYTYHRMYREASAYMYILAHSEENLLIDDRLRFLQRAADSAALVCEDSAPVLLGGVGFSPGLRNVGNTNSRIPQPPTDTLELSAYVEYLKEVRDEVITTAYQVEAYREMQALKNEIDRDPYDTYPLSTESRRETSDGQETPHVEWATNIDAVLTALETRLLTISELFNDVTLPWNLWVLALGLLHHSGLDAPDAVRKLWKSILYRKIPVNASTAEGELFLQQQRSGLSIFVDQRHQNRQGTFENPGTWLTDVENAIVATGQKIYRHVDISHSFYLDHVLEILEELSIQLTVVGTPVPRGWAAMLLLQFGPITQAILVDLYIRLFDFWIGTGPERAIHLISALSFVLSVWVTKMYEKDRADDLETIHLLQSIRSGYLHEWLNKIDRHINTVRASIGHTSHTGSKRLVEAAETVIKIRSMIQELMM